MAGGKGGNIFSADKGIFTKTTPIVWYSVVIFSMSGLLFGYDTAMFGAMQTTKSWLNTFGTVTSKTGVKSMTTGQTSMLNSFVWLGKVFGILMANKTNEMFGPKTAMLISSAIQALGITVEMVAKNWKVFLVGRTFLYMAMGFPENIAPLYIAEIVSPTYRGFFIAVYPILLNVGSCWSNGAINALSHRTDSSGWLIACAMQFAPMVVLVAGLYWCPTSPRWLLQKGRREQGQEVMRRIRSEEDYENGWVELELQAIEHTIEAEKSIDGSASFLQCFRGNNLRRTIICAMIWAGNQLSGNQFVTAYAPTLYVALGRSAQAYTYSTLKAVLGLISTISGGLIVDRTGRRPILIIGCAAQAFFLFLLGGLGTISNPSVNVLNTMVACILLFKVFVTCSLNQLCFTVGAEVSSLRLRKKTFAIGTLVDVASAFAVTYSSPYLLNAQYANLGGKVGFIWGGLCVWFLIFSILFVPELKGRSLEETDEMFEAKLWAWKFKGYKTTGLGARLAAHGAGEDTEEDQALAAKARLGVELDEVTPLEDMTKHQGDLTHVEKL